MGAAHCIRCEAPYADRTGLDPCPRCGGENPSIKLQAEARERAETDRLEAKWRAERKAESERARALREEERIARGEPTPAVAVAKKAARVGGAVAWGAATVFAVVLCVVFAAVGAFLVVAGVIDGMTSPVRPLVLMHLGFVVFLVGAGAFREIVRGRQA